MRQVTLPGFDAPTRTVRRWQPYPTHKDSGVDWLGHIPGNWEVIRVKLLAGNHSSVVQTGPFGAQLHASDYVDDGIPLILIRNVSSLQIDSSNIPRVTLEDADRLSTYRLKAGDIIFSRVGSIGRIALCTAREEGWLISGQMLRLRIVNPRLYSRFALFALSSEPVLQFVELKSIGSTRDSINTDILRNVPIPLPPLDEQRAIAAFLDRETAKIDALIAKKERLIEMLQERRLALISHAVTKGLDPSAPMRDSGNEWLGEIPAHWVVKRFKHLISYITSGSRGWAEYYSDEGPLFIRVGNVSGNPSVELDLRDTQRVLPPLGTEGERTRIQKNDVLIAITGATIGAVAVVANEIGEAYVNQHVALTRPMLSRVIPKWLGYSVYSSSGQSQVDVLLTGGTKQGLGLDDVKNFVVGYPPPHEQQGIVEFLEQKDQQFNETIAKIVTAIERLQEYRTALISAAVTGKIDVRGEIA